MASPRSRVRRPALRCALALALAPLLAPSLSEAAPAGFQAGEALTYDMSVGMIQAGRARMSVGAPERLRGQRLVAVQGDAHSAEWLRVLAHLDDTYKVVLDVDDLVPRHVVTVETGLRERTIDVEVAREPARSDRYVLVADVVLPGGHHAHAKHPLPAAVRDPVASLFLLRGARLADGDVIELYALDGMALYRASARVVRREPLLRDGKPPLASIRVEVHAQRCDDRGRPVSQPPRSLTVWLSDDDRRVPYRIEGETDLGTAKFELTSYTPGTPVTTLAAVPPGEVPRDPGPVVGRLRLHGGVRLPVAPPRR